MYQPVPLNWIAGADSSFWTRPAHLGQRVRGGSEKRWITSKVPQDPHSYSYRGTRGLRGLVDGLQHQDDDRDDQEDDEELVHVAGERRRRVRPQRLCPLSEVPELSTGERRDGRSQPLRIMAQGFDRALRIGPCEDRVDRVRVGLPDDGCFLDALVRGTERDEMVARRGGAREQKERQRESGSPHRHRYP